MLGPYPLVPGEPWYAVSVPAFAHTTLDSGRGRRITVRRVGPRDGLVVRAGWNGHPLDDWRVTHAALLAGGTLTVTTRPR